MRRQYGRGFVLGSRPEINPPLKEIKRAILAQRAKERQGERTDLKKNIPVNLPESGKETRDAMAAEIGVAPAAALDDDNAGFWHPLKNVGTKKAPGAMGGRWVKSL